MTLSKYRLCCATNVDSNIVEVDCNEASGCGEHILVTTLKGLLAPALRDPYWSDESDRRNDLQITVWVRWVAGIGWLIVNNYIPDLDAGSYIPNNLIALGVIAFNAYVHYRLRTNRRITWQIALALSVADLGAISWGLFNSDGFYSSHYVLYYPALAIFCVLFSSIAACIICGVLVSLAYAAISVASVPGHTLTGDEDTTLLLRILAMLVVIGLVNLVTRYERFRRGEAVAQAVELERQRIELSRAIHDTVAQTAYMIGIGIETARRLADHSNQELMNSLDATYALAQSAIWEAQAPIDGGLIFQGIELAQVVRAHAATFNDITSIPANVNQKGDEPPFSTASKGLIFSIIHNALTNVIRHAQAENVTITLEFQRDGIRISVSDDGVGLPQGYSERGAGFPNMVSSAEQMGGRLETTSNQPGRGTTVTCWLPAIPHTRG